MDVNSDMQLRVQRDSLGGCALRVLTQATSTRGGCEPQQLLDGFKSPLISLQLFHQTSQFFHPSDLLIVLHLLKCGRHLIAKHRLTEESLRAISAACVL